MVKKTWLAVLMLAASAILVQSTTASAKKTADSTLSQDDAFVALREASRNGDADRAAYYADHLGDYAIPSYVDYYRLRAHIQTATAAEVLDFLSRYEGSAIADRMRNDWLLVLGYTGDWKNFDEQLPLFVLNDDRQVKCYALLSQLAKGQTVASDARALLTAPKEYGEACPMLIKALVQAGQFDQSDVDAQVRMAAESTSSAMVRRIAATVGDVDNMLIQAVDKPAVVVAHGPGKTSASHQIFIVALGRDVKVNLPQAVSALEGAERALNKEERAEAWAAIAAEASFKLAPEAMSYWQKVGNAPLLYGEYPWRVRTALLAGDWKAVESDIVAMPEKLRNDPAWIYWLGRAMQAAARPAEAQVQFQLIADQTNFYGQLAQEELGRKIAIPPRPLPPTDAEMAAVSANLGFRRALKFLDLNLRTEGYREWNWELRKMSEHQHFAAAEFARQNDLLDRMISTSDHTKIEMDFAQRYPSPYDELMRPATDALNLDEAWVYGVIRQESRFIRTARSYVGAQGLMQIMPGTAKFIAHKIGLVDYTPGQASEIATNITLGTNYLNMIFNDLDQSEVLATAAYNAGPGRPRSWRANLNGPVEGAVFTEAIPFAETREYVRNVMSNATYYAALLENKPQSLKARLGTIVPKGYTPSDLP